MCDVCDVLQSSFQPANAMTSALCEYGDGDMGFGIRKLAGEMLTVGGKEGYDNGFSDGYPKGFLDGFFQGENRGIIKGTVISTVTIGTVGLAVWGIKAIYNHIKQTKKQGTTDETEEI